MKRQSRREFLRNGMAMSGALAVGSIAPKAVAQAPSLPDMSIVRGPADVTGEAVSALAEKLTERAITELGGMKRFLSDGNSVWIKPNIAWDQTPDKAANTNPDVVKTLVRLCFEAGAKTVKVGDNTCNEAKNTYRNTGIADAAKAAGAEVVFIDDSRFRKTAIGGARLPEIGLYPEMMECDLMINVPVVKHHGSTTVSLCMKNYMGVVDDRGRFHQDLPGCIRDITAYLKPRLCVLDAIRILTAHGPRGGNLADVKQMNTVAAGTDIVALDAFGAELLGNNPREIGTIVAGYEGGLGEIDYKKLALREITIS